MNCNTKRFVKLLSLVLAVLITTAVLQELVFRRFDAAQLMIESFYMEDENSLDVVMIGASEITAGYAAGLAYEEYGYRSYCIAPDSNPVSLFLYELKEVLKTQSPQLVVVEINGALYDSGWIHEEPMLRRVLDCAPLTQNKIDAINQTVGNLDYSYLFPMAKYHYCTGDYRIQGNGIASYNQARFRGYSLFKGMKTFTGNTTEGELYDMRNYTEKAPLDPLSEEYLREFLDYCKAENINAIFVRFPHRVTDYNLRKVPRANTAKEIINSYGFDYYDYLTDPSVAGIDLNKHFYNNEHLNVEGQAIMTRVICDLAKKHGVKITDAGDEQDEEWAEVVKYYHLFYDYAIKASAEGKKEWLSENISTLNKIEINK